MAARNQLDRSVTFAEKATGAIVTGIGGAMIDAVIELPFNMLDHAVDKAIDPDHKCEDDPHDVCGDKEEWEPQTTGIISDEYSDWK